ncbi:MAG: hypothetical protein K6F68_01345 [Clostridiales bacterium]|nr:hypothetical protein [Clostridiales bacterium]
MADKFSSEVISGIDEKLVPEAAEARKRRRGRIIWRSAAVCAVIILGLAVFFFGVGKYAFLERFRIERFKPIGIGGGKFTFDIPDEKLPEAKEANVYRVKRVILGRETVIRVAALLGSESTDVLENGDGSLLLKDGNIGVSSRAGFFGAHVRGKENRDAVRLPDDEYIRKAWAFLEKTGIPLNDYEPEPELDSYSDDGVILLFPRRPIDAVVTEIEGEGTSIMVELNRSGEITGLSIRPYEFTFIGTYPLMDAAEVMNLCETDPADAVFVNSLYGEGGIAAEARLAWFLIPVTAVSKSGERSEDILLLPVYIFSGGSGPDGFYVIARALPSRYLEIVPDEPKG